MVKTVPSNAGGGGCNPWWGAKISQALRPKNQKYSRSNIVTNLIDFKNVPHEKNLKKKRC